MLLIEAADRRDRSAKRGSRNRLEKSKSADRVIQSTNKMQANQPNSVNLDSIGSSAISHENRQNCFRQRSGIGS